MKPGSPGFHSPSPRVLHGDTVRMAPEPPRRLHAIAVALALALAAVRIAAAGTDPGRWAERTAPVFQLVASQSNGDTGMPYTGNPGVLAQDDKGFIWIGTETGLERWDGYRIRAYAARPGDPCALQSDNVWALYADERKQLWIGTLGGGVARYDPETDCIRAVGSSDDALRSATVESLAGDGTGGLWVGTSTGLQHLSADLTRVTRLPADASEQGRLSHERIVRLLRDRSGALWAGTDNGLERMAGTDAHFKAVALPSRAAGSVKVRALFESSNGRIWVGTLANGAYVIDPATMQVRAVEEILGRSQGHGIWAATETPRGEVWLATHDSGIVGVDPVSLHTRVIRHQKGVPTSLPSDSVFDLLADRAGLIWVASDSGWVGHLQTEDAIATILTADESNGVPEGAVAAIALTENDQVAIGVGRKIVLIGPHGTGAEAVQLDLPLPPDKVTSLATPNGRDLIAGVNPIGLIWIDRTARRSYTVPLPGPHELRHVESLLLDAGRLWVGALEGIWVLEPQAPDKRSAVPWAVTHQYDLRNVLTIAAGTGAVRWFGTTNGLFRSQDGNSMPTRVQLIGPSGASLPDMFMTTLYTDPRGRLWAGTSSQGIFILDPSAAQGDRIPVLRQLLGELPNPGIDRILEDSTGGGIWVSTDRGLARVDGDSFVARRFGRGDGDAVSDYYIGSGAVTAAHELLFGGQGGITVIRPERLPPTRSPPPLVISRISVGHREVPSAGHNDFAIERVLEVPADAQSVAVEFSALDYADPQHIEYAYRLDGYDRNWVKTGFENRVASYTNLAPGLYHLRFRATDHAGVWSPVEGRLILRVAAAWYQTMWFHALEALGALLAVFLIVHARTTLLRARQRELESLVEERTEALVRATAARNTLIENLAHDLRTPITSLRGYLETLNLKDATLSQLERGQFIAIAVRQAARLNRLVRELFDLVRLDDARMRLSLERFSPAELAQDVVQEFGSIADGRTIAFDCDPAAESTQMVGDINLMQRMIDNLVDNALRHTPQGGVITVKLATTESDAVIEVRDTGRGIERADLDRIFDRYTRGEAADRIDGAGLGLAIVKRIVELHGGRIVVDSEIGVGTRFTVRLPLIATAGEW